MLTHLVISFFLLYFIQLPQTNEYSQIQQSLVQVSLNQPMMNLLGYTTNHAF